MSVVVLDHQATEKLGSFSDRTEVRDSNGRLVGLFMPVSVLEPPISREELDRRAQGPGRPLADILADLRAKS